jgi:uncharacterized membrane protein
MPSLAVQARRRLRAFRESLLFYPVLLTLGAVLLFTLTSFADVVLGEGALATDAPWGFLVFAGGSEAASRLLSSVAATFATIAGVVYSVTLVTIQLSATKYSAQVIPSFERDRFNQLVLGAFTGTFVYALLVLKTVRTDGAVPVVGVNVAVVLAVASLFLFIGFIGNLTTYIRPTRFVDDLARKGLEALPTLRQPQGLEGFTPAPTPAEQPGRPRGTEVAAEEEGYVVDIGWANLRQALVVQGQAGVLPEAVRLQVATGTRVLDRTVVVRVEGLHGEVPPRLAEDLRGCVELLEVRSVVHDPTFANDTLEDIAFTAMSGGATDIGVARSCAAGLLRLAAADLREPPTAGAFMVATAHGAVRLEREAPDLAKACMVSTTRVLDKAWNHSYWMVGETIAEHLGEVALSAAQADQARWDAFLAWTKEASQRLFGAGEPGARQRIAHHLAQAVGRVRAEGHEERARAWEEALLLAAQEQGAEEALRTLVAETV